MSIPNLVFFSLTPEEEDESMYCHSSDEEDMCTWIDDSECQENLCDIISLTPEETTIDKDNHIQTTYKFFFEELGYFTEEPEPIDPTRDYDQEAKDLLNRRNKKVRQNHINISCTPSLEFSKSGISSSSSSIHHDHFVDVRSPHYMGKQHGHCNTINDNLAYHYGTNLDAKHYPYQTYHPSRVY
jgi:hypothetical protein